MNMKTIKIFIGGLCVVSVCVCVVCGSSVWCLLHVVFCVLCVVCCVLCLFTCLFVHLFTCSLHFNACGQMTVPVPDAPLLVGILLTVLNVLLFFFFAEEKE